MYISMYGDKNFEMPVRLFDVFQQRELTLTGCRVSPYGFPRTLQMLEHMDLEPFTEKSYLLDEAEEAFECHFSGRYPKVLINCNADLADL